nr:tRNA lysidine(34) synthetase TilS [Desulfoprunum benzoelyticum]
MQKTISQVIVRNKLLKENDSVVVGVSGGPDSTALLLLLAETDLNLQCIAAYIDHGLRPGETGAEQDTVAQLAATTGTRFCSRAVPARDYAAALGLSLEEAARILRYQALEAIRLEYDAAAIAVAHTADDQVEEFLLRLVRGSGRKGLAGMDYRHGRVIRPLLNLNKQTLLHFLAARNIPYCVDSSNLDRRFLRNRVRLDLLPLLEDQFNPSIRRTILQTMEILGREEELLADLTKQALPLIEEKGPDRLAVPLPPLDAIHPAIRRRIIERCCWTLGARPTFRQIDRILALTDGDGPGREVHLGGGLRMRRTADSLEFRYPLGRTAFRGSGRAAIAIDTPIPAPGVYPIAAIGAVLELRLEEVPVEPAGRLCVDAARISFPLRLRSVVAGQRFRPPGRGGSRKVNRFLSDHGISSEMRDCYPVLMMQEQIVALPGLEIDESFRLTAASRTALVIRWRPAETGERGGR